MCLFVATLKNLYHNLTKINKNRLHFKTEIFRLCYITRLLITRKYFFQLMAYLVFYFLTYHEERKYSIVFLMSKKRIVKTYGFYQKLMF